MIIIMTASRGQEVVGHKGETRGGWTGPSVLFRVTARFLHEGKGDGEGDGDRHHENRYIPRALYKPGIT